MWIPCALRLGYHDVKFISKLFIEKAFSTLWEQFRNFFFSVNTSNTLISNLLLLIFKFSAQAKHSSHVLTTHSSSMEISCFEFFAMKFINSSTQFITITSRATTTKKQSLNCLKTNASNHFNYFF